MIRVKYGSGTIKNFSKLNDIFDDEKMSIIEIYCSGNKITEIPKEICQLINLHTFICSSNQITEIPKEIFQLINLHTFGCSSNKITEIPIDIINCRNLTDISIYGNEIELSPIIQRFINRMGNILNHKIYNDAQNIHASSIQKSVRDSIICLLNDKYSISDDDIRRHIIDNPHIRCKERLFEYIDCKEEHSTLYCTFNDLFIKVYGRIISNEHQDELWKRLNEEVIESECKCYTGRLSRLVNVLNGYYDDIKITISDNEQISNIILSIRNKMTDEKEIKEECMKELTIRGYDKETINLWLDNL